MISSNILLGQEDYILNIKKLGIDDGLLGERTKVIRQDKDGIIWIATQDGLNRYDGYTFQWFNQSNSDLNYRNVKMNGIKEDEEGYLWLIYENGNVECFHRQTFEVKTLKERFGELPFEITEIKNIIAKSGQQLIIQTKNGRFFRWTSDFNFEHLSFLDKKRVDDFYENELWYYQDTLLIIADYQGKVLESVPNLIGKLRLLKKEAKSRLYYSIENSLSSSQIVIYDYQNHQLTKKHTADLPLNSKIRLGQYLKKIDKILLFDKYEKNEKDNDYYVLDLNTSKISKIQLEVYHWLQHIDKNGVIWFTTLEGITLMDIQPQRFDIYKEAYKSRGIWANENMVFISSDENRHKFYYDIKTQEKLPNFNQKGTAIELSHKKEFWTAGNQIKQINPLDNTIIQAIPRASNLEDRIWSLLKDKEKRFWVGLTETEINVPSIGIYDKTKSDSIQYFNQYNEFATLKSATPYHLLEDENHIWASSDKGLILVHKEKGVVGHYHQAASDKFRLPFEALHFLYKDQQGVYWAATNYDGLVRFELDENKNVIQVKQFMTYDGLSSNVLYTIFEDQQERLWMSTLKGISCFNKKTEEVLVFSAKNGLLNNEFNRISGFQAADGRIYFGSIKGAVGFHPDNVLQQAKYVPNFLISSVYKYSERTEQLTNETAEVLNTKTIVQLPSERYFTIEVTLTDYFNPKALTYEYQIKGLHDDYRRMNGNSLQLSSLPYGKYTLHIRGKTADKRYEIQEMVLNLHIIRPFYLRWWFILLSIALVIFSSWRFYNYRVSALKKQRDILEKTVEERTHQIQQDKQIIEQQAEELKALDQLKDRFFTNISHELRTPLTLILGPLGTLLKSKNFSNKEYTLTRVIERHAQYLLKRINEIMELNRLEANKSQVNLAPVRFYDFVKVAVSNFESIAPEKNITFLFDYQLSKSLQIQIDRDKYEHILYNYLSNAFKYTAKNGMVEVVLKEENQQIVLIVKDNGIGIAQADIPHVFDRFYQANTAQKASSSGIGLSLCREIAELINGQVWVESEVGAGSSFYFKMPFKEVLGIVESESIENTSLPNFESLVNLPNEDKSTILLVEDNTELRQYISLILSEKYNVVTAENGKVALDKLQEPSAVNRQPSAVISDIMMPIMDGLELLEKVKATDTLRHIPMIMLTARTNMEAKLSALQLGVDDYITKPFNEDELLIRVQNLLNNQKERIAFIQENPTEKKPSENTIQISKSDQNWLQEVEQVVNDNLHNSQFTKLDWAIELNISERQLRRKIKQLTGLTLTKYLQLARLEMARQILESGEKSTVAEVSYAVGFETPKYFSKIFKQQFGKRPVEYFKTTL